MTVSRRSFLTTLAASVGLGSVLKRLAPSPVAAKFELGEVYPSFPHEVKEYSLGFSVTQEMIEDDIYTNGRPWWNK